MRQSLEQELEIRAKTGDTASLIAALEEGAPFVLDMVSNIGWHSYTLSLGQDLSGHRPHVIYPFIIDLRLLHGQFCIKTESCN